MMVQLVFLSCPMFAYLAEVLTPALPALAPGLRAGVGHDMVQSGQVMQSPCPDTSPLLPVSDTDRRFFALRIPLYPVI
jgi:hypothetical protein